MPGEKTARAKYQGFLHTTVMAHREQQGPVVSELRDKHLDSSTKSQWVKEKLNWMQRTRVGRRPFLAAMTAILGTAAGVGRVRAALETSTDVNHSTHNIEFAAQAEQEKERSIAYLHECANRMNVAGMKISSFLTHRAQFTFPEEHRDWSFSPETSRLPTRIVYTLLLEKLELGLEGRVANPEYYPFLLGQEDTPPASSRAVPRRLAFTEDPIPNQSEQMRDASIRWEVLARSLQILLGGNQPQRCAEIQATQSEEIQLDNGAAGRWSAVTDGFAGRIKLAVIEQLESGETKVHPPTVAGFKTLIHELLHLFMPRPIISYLPSAEGKETLLGHPLHVFVELYEDMTEIFMQEYAYFENKYLADEYSFERQNIARMGVEGVFITFNEWFPIFLTDALTEDITVFESYPTSLQDFLLSYLGKVQHVGRTFDPFTKENLIEIRAEIAQLRKTLIDPFETGTEFA